MQDRNNTSRPIDEQEAAAREVLRHERGHGHMDNPPSEAASRDRDVDVKYGPDPL